GDVVTLEGVAELHWVRYARWSGGEMRRCFEYSADEGKRAGWVRSEGPPEAWEEDDEVGPDVEGVAGALGVAGPPDVPASWSRELVIEAPAFIELPPLGLEKGRRSP